MSIPIPAPDTPPRRRLRPQDRVIVAVLLRSDAIARLVARLRRTQTARHAAGMIVVAVRSDPDADARSDLAQVVPVAPWLGKVTDPAEEWEVTDPEGRVVTERREGPGRRGFGGFEFFTIAVRPGTEQLAVMVVRRLSGRLLTRRVIVGRWPRFELAAAPLSGWLTSDALSVLAARAAEAGREPHRVAVVDTPFNAPPGVHVVQPTGAALTGTYRHGAAVCSLILGSSPDATVDLYPVIRGDGQGVDGLDVLAALRRIAHRAEDGAPVDVVNLSLTTPDGRYAEEVVELVTEALLAIAHASSARTVFVAATGNHGGPMGLPARLPEVLGVGCVDGAGVLWPASGRGPKPASALGPYGWLVATGVGVVDGDPGTSYAAAAVSGLIARAVSTGQSALDAVIALEANADRGDAGYDPTTHGAGRALER